MDTMTRLIYTLFVLLVATSGSVSAQRVLTLSQAIERARRQSVDAAVALDQLKTAYWEYRTYRADLLPEVNLKASLPDYTRGFNLYQNEDGSYKYVRNNLLRMSGDLSIEQNIPLTGAKVSINSSLQYIDPLNTQGGHRHFMSVPIGVSIVQPILGTNHLRWRGRIEPIKYKEAQAAYVESVEQLTLRTISYYFELLLATENLNIAKQNKKSADRIAEIAEARREMGQISQNELLQLRLSALNAASALTKEESTLSAAMFRLKSFLGLEEGQSLTVLLPDMMTYPEVTYEEVLEQAQHNNPFAQSIRRRQLEADYEVAKAKGEQRDISLFASFGYTGQDRALKTAYQELMDNQVVQVGVRLPLIDWGKRKGRVKVAESNRSVIASRLKQAQMDFNQNVFLLVQQYHNQTEQLRIAQEADRIARQRYETSVESFMIGKINTLDLSDAQVSKDTARAKYISEMHLYWHYLYQLRSLTLYDYVAGQPLGVEIDSLLKD